MSPTERRHHNHQVALWAALSAFFGSVAAFGLFDILNPAEWVQYLGAIFIAAITAGGVYAHQRLEDAKREEANGGN